MHRAPRSTAKPRRAVEERSLGDVARGDEVIVKVGGDAEVRQTARIVGGRSAGIGRLQNDGLGDKGCQKPPFVQHRPDRSSPHRSAHSRSGGSRQALKFVAVKSSASRRPIAVRQLVRAFPRDSDPTTPIRCSRAR
jgi:hypothetical protein